MPLYSVLVRFDALKDTDFCSAGEMFYEHFLLNVPFTGIFSYVVEFFEKRDYYDFCDMAIVSVVRVEDM